MRSILIILFCLLSWILPVSGQNKRDNRVLITPLNYSKNVGLYNKAEAGLVLPEQVNEQVDIFLGGQAKKGLNPYDPEDISIEATFTSKSGTVITIYGFYYVEFNRNLKGGDKWQISRTSHPWRVRFAPNELGTWTCRLVVRIPDLKMNLELDNCLEINCIPSENQGYLEIGNDKRHLRYSGTKASFFAIGQNIAWPLERAENWETGRVSAQKFSEFNSAIQDLGDNSGNYFRFILATWGHAIEWETLGNYYPRMSRAWEIDKIFQIAEAEKMFIHLCLEMQTNHNSATGERISVGGWENNPYNSLSKANGSSFSGVLTPNDVLASKEAKKYYKRRLRYIIARWGYSTSLGVLEFMNELDHSDGFKKDTEMQKNSVDWHRDMYNFIWDSLDHKQHLMTTSYGGNPHRFRVSGKKGNRHPYDFMHLTNIHQYRSQRGSGFIFYNSLQKKSYGMVNGKWKGKPTIFAEIGMQAGAWQTRSRENKADIGDIEGCDGISFHNTTWAASFMGGYGVGLYWWQYHNKERKEANMSQLASFFREVDFEAVNFNRTQRWRDGHLNVNYKNECELIGNIKFTREVYALTSKDRTQAIGWAHNATYYWGNTESMTTCKDRADLTIELPCDDDEYSEPLSIQGENIKIKGLKPWKRYKLEWYTTNSYGLLSSVEKRSNWLGRLKPRYPSDSEPDLAFKVKRAL